MSLGAVGTLPVGLSDLDFAVPNPLALLYADPDARYTLLLIAEPVSLGTLGTDWPYAVATEAVETLDAEDAEPQPVLYLSDRGFLTEPDDDVPNQIFAPRLITAYSFETAIPVPGGDSPARGSSSFGAIEISNADGALDWVTDATMAGRPVEVRIGGTINPGRAGERALRYAEYATLIKGTVDSVTWSDTRITLALRDNAQRLEVPLQTATYAGTGGAEGGAELAGALKPVGYGQVGNAQPVAIDTVNDVHQFHDGLCNAVLAVRDKGVPLAFCGTDYPDYAALVAATRGALGSGADIEAGEYATCKAAGMIRLGAPPAGTVTVDFQGDASGGYVETAPEIARRIAVTRAGLADPDEIDAGAVAQLALDRPAPVSLWNGGEQVNVADAIDELIGGVDAWWLFTRDGRLSMGANLDPEIVPAIAVIGAAEIIEASITRQPTPEPVWQYRLGCARVVQVQSADDLSTSLSAADKALYGQEYRYAVSQNAAGRSLFRSARAVEINTPIRLQSDAQTDADRRLDRDSQRRDLYRLDKKRMFFQHRPGDVVSLSAPRFGLPAGRNFLVIRVAEDADTRTTTLDLWG